MEFIGIVQSVRATMITRTTIRRISCALLLLLAMVPAHASTRPRYGGSVRILLQHKIMSLDPTIESDYPADRDKLASLLFETLTELDAQGHVRPKLASSWQADSSSRVWQFQLRGASFHDGTAVTAASVVSALKAVNPDWKITANGKQAITIELPSAIAYLPEMLSLPRFAIVKRLTNNTLAGTGPYKLSEFQAGQRALFYPNDEYWGGRPFPDAVEVLMGVPLREHLLERQLGRDHAAEVTIDQLRALEQTPQNVLLSHPSDLLVIVFPPPSNTRRSVDPKIRAALSEAINRMAISNVLLQRKSIPANGLLPQWLSGYEFAFGDAGNPDQARRLRAEVAGSASLTLAYDFSDPVARLVADRIAVDAREIGISVQAVGDPHVSSKAGRKSLTADAFLLHLPLESLDPAVALAALADDLELPAEIQNAISSANRAESLFASERRIMEDYRIIPVAHVSEALWLNNSVHNWQQLANGTWNVEQVWVEK
jgi:ABC-type transport system substrate-binding protein